MVQELFMQGTLELNQKEMGITAKENKNLTLHYEQYKETNNKIIYYTYLGNNFTL